MRRTKSLTALAVLAVALGLAGCGGSGPSSSPSSSPPATDRGPGGTAAATPTAAPELAWQRTDLEPFSGAVKAGGLAIVLTTAHRHVYLTALDATTGKTAWQRETEVSATTPGVAFTPTVFGATAHPRLVVLTPRGSGDAWVRLTVVDALTGKAIADSGPAWVSEQPERCERGAGVSPRDACLVAWDAAAQQWVDVSVSGTAAHPSPVYRSRASAWPHGRGIGPLGLTDNGLRDGKERLGRVDGKKVLWSVSTTARFGATASTDSGWNFAASADESVIWGSVGVKSGRQGTIDESALRTVGFDAETGKVLWSVPATSSFCRSWTNEDAGDSDADDTPVRCAGTGLLRYTKKGKVTADGFSASLQGFDPHTGKTSWSVPLGDDTTLFEDAAVPLAGEQQIAVQTASGPAVVDLTSGQTRAVGAGEEFVCRTSASVKYYRGVTYGAQTVYDRRGGSLATLCDVTGKRIEAPIPASLLAVAGQKIGATVVVAGKHGVSGWSPVTVG
jgi:outer membrane protein assembly factor BamB